MKILLLAALAALALSHSFQVNDDVIVLNDENFNNALEEFSSGLLVKFYAPWCGHCQKLAPEYSQAARVLKQQDPPLFLAEVDATVAETTAQLYEIQGYPTLIFFVNKQPLKYTGGRTEQEIVSWANKQMGPAVNILNTRQELAKEQEDNPLALLFFGDSSQENYAVFENVCKQIEGFSCFSIKDEGVAKEFEAQVNQFILLKPFDEGKSLFQGNYQVQEILQFVNENRLPLVSEFDEGIAQSVFGQGNTGLFLFKANEETQYDQLLGNLAKKLRGTFIVSYSQVSQGLGKRLGDYLGVQTDVPPSVWIVVLNEETRELNKFRMEGEISEETIQQFIDQLMKGEVQPYFKSQEIPAEPYENGVRVLVAKNFNEVVFDNSKDVLVEFYAPWCGHCQQLAPQYEQAARDLSHVKSLIIAKIDATENEVQGINIQGFPTLKFFPAETKTETEYDGPRDAEGIKNWLKNQVTIGFKEEL